MRGSVRVERSIQRLRERYGRVPVRRQRWPVDADTYRATSRRAEQGTVGGAGAWVRRRTAEDTEVLLVWECDADGWSEPAGKQEPGESLTATARREVREETGIGVTLDGVRLATKAIHTHEANPPLARLVVVFDARPSGRREQPTNRREQPTPRDGEIDRVAWHSSHPDRLRYPALREFPI